MTAARWCICWRLCKVCLGEDTRTVPAGLSKDGFSIESILREQHSTWISDNRWHQSLISWRRQTIPLSFRLFHVFISAAGGAGVIIGVELLLPLAMFSFLFDLGLHFNLNFSRFHVHILGFRFWMDHTGVGSHSALFLVRSRLTLWAFLFLDAQAPVWRVRGFSIADGKRILIGGLGIASSTVRSFGVSRLCGVSLRGGGSTLCVRAIVTSWRCKRRKINTSNNFLT